MLHYMLIIRNKRQEIEKWMIGLWVALAVAGP